MATLNKHSLPRVRKSLKIPRPYAVIGEESQDLFEAASKAIEAAELTLTRPRSSQPYSRLERDFSGGQFGLNLNHGHHKASTFMQVF